MANGYLGKISAIVTANTGDFKPKLDAAASDVRQFAKSMQSSLGSASRDASRAFEGIYTPLQKIERALKAAADTKIAFKGYAGQIQNIDDLKKRLAELNRRQIDVSVSGTSFSSIAALRKAIDGVTSRHMEAVVNAGGLDRARSVVAYQRAEEGRGAYGPVVAVDTNGLDVAVEKMAMLRSEKDVEVAIRVVDGRLLEDAVTKFKRLTSVSKEIDGPLTAAKERLLGLSMAIQTAVHPALVSLQAADEKLHAAIDKNADISTKAYMRLRKEVEAFNAAVAIGAEADSLASRVGDGRSLKGLFPRQYDALKAAGDATASAGELSGADLKGFGVTRQQAIVDRQASMLATMQAKRATMIGDTSALDASIERTTARLEKETATYLRLIGAAKEYQKSQPTLGNPTGTFGPAAPSGSRVVGGVTRVPVDRNEHSTGASTPYYPGQAPGNPSGPFGPMPTDDMKRALAATEALEESMDSLKAKSRFMITGDVQNVKQAEAEVSRLIDLVMQLKTDQRKGVQGAIDAAATAVASGDIPKARAAIASLKADLKKLGVKGTGDIGRGGADRFTLGLQQAAFAIDDFFSVTGDASQRLRAMGNNLTQIGFIMGNTTGLIVALAASLTAQGVVAFIKYANSGREAKDSAKALTDTLEKQKSIVKELADAFRSFASEIASSGFKGASKDAAELSSRLDEIRKKQRERSTERDALLNPDLQRTRATINARERTLADTSDVGRAATIRAEIRELRAQERAQVRAMQNRPRVSVDEAMGVVEDSRRLVSGGRVRDVQNAAGGFDGQAIPVILASRREQASNDAALAADRAGLAAAGTEAERLSFARRSVEAQLASSRATAESGRGIVGTTYAGAAAEREVARLEDLLNRLNAGIASALDKIEIEVSKQAILAAGRIGSSLEALEQAVGGSAALTLRVNTELTMFAGQLRDAQQNLANAVEAGDTDAAQAAREEIEAIVDATSSHVSVAKSVASFGEALNRVSTQLTNTVLGEAKSDAEQARRKENAAQAVAGNSDAAVEEAEAMNRRRSRIEANAREAEDREADIRRKREADVRRFEDDASGGRLDKETQDIIRQRDEAQAQIDAARNDGRTVSGGAVRRRDEGQRVLDRQFEFFEAGKANRGRADEFDRDQARNRQNEQDITRGRELMRSPAERAGKELADGLRGLQAAYDEDENYLQGDFEKDRLRLVQDSMRQQAPAIFNLADSVENAIMQGPSRSALQASDVTTTQGAAELSRLLRGDDTAKNQDLVELQKQSSALQELVAIARENGAPPGIFD